VGTRTTRTGLETTGGAKDTAQAQEDTDPNPVNVEQPARLPNFKDQAHSVAALHPGAM